MEPCSRCQGAMTEMELVDGGHREEIRVQKPNGRRSVPVKCMVCRECGDVRVFVPQEKLSKLRKLLEPI